MILVAALAASVLAAPAPAPSTAPPDLPGYAVGDAFVYSNGGIERVRGLSNGNVIWGGLTGRSWTRPVNFVAPILEWRLRGQEGRRTVLGRPDDLWPLRKGHLIQFRVVTESRDAGRSDATWRRSLSLWSCRSGAPRTVRAPAGEFEAWPIRCDRFAVTTMRPIEQITWDYAPEVGHYIRRTSIAYRDGRRHEILLVAALHGPAATDERLQALARPFRKRSTGRAG